MKFGDFLLNAYNDVAIVNAKEGKYFVKQILPKCKHMVTIRSSKVLDGYTDYIMGIEDYYIAQELLEKIES